MVIFLERGANDLHMVQLTPTSSLALLKSRLVYHFWHRLLPDYPGCSAKEAIKQVSKYVECLTYGNC